MNSDILRQSKVKIEQINSSNPSDLLQEVKSIIDRLNKHIDETILLEESEIEQLCKSLTRFTTLPAIPFASGLWVGRARKIKKDEPYYTNIDDLSYNKDISKVKLQRMNRKGQSLFYCSFGGKITPSTMISTILSEVNAKKGESYYVLASKITETIHCSPIGVFDYCRRGVEHPFKLHEDINTLYSYYKEHTHKDGMLAIELCDAFLTNILKMENDENNRVYQITSEISNDCLNSSMDGLIYPSVKFEGYPNLVLRTEVVDNKLSHEEVYEYEVLKNLGYGIYEFVETKRATVRPQPNGYIAWYPETYDLGDGSFVSYSSPNIDK